MVDPELQLKDIQMRQRQRQEVAANDRLADEHPNPARALIGQTGEALVQLGTQLRAWGGVSEQPGAPQKWDTQPTNAGPTPAPASPRSQSRPCPEAPTLTWEKGEGVYRVTVSAHDSSR